MDTIPKYRKRLEDRLALTVVSVGQSCNYKDIRAVEFNYIPLKSILKKEKKRKTKHCMFCIYVRDKRGKKLRTEIGLVCDACFAEKKLNTHRTLLSSPQIKDCL